MMPLFILQDLVDEHLWIAVGIVIGVSFVLVGVHELYIRIWGKK